MEAAAVGARTMFYNSRFSVWRGLIGRSLGAPALYNVTGFPFSEQVDKNGTPCDWAMVRTRSARRWCKSLSRDDQWDTRAFNEPLSQRFP